MPDDKSLRYYGPLYHRLFDPPISQLRQAALGLIEDDSEVLDIACGTGQLSFALATEKNCRVVGSDRIE